MRYHLKLTRPDYVWLWVAIEAINRQVLALSISKERNMFVTEIFISVLIDGGTWYQP
jgi:putative transposase